MSTKVFYKNKLSIKSMALTSIMLALNAIFSFVSNTYLPLPFLSSFLTFDISLIFLVPIIFLCDKKWWIIASFGSGLFTFLWSGVGGWVGAIFNVIVNVCFSFLFFCSKKIYTKDNKLNKKSFIFSLVVKLIIIILFNCLLNGFLFTPLYWWTFNVINSPNFLLAEKIYNSNESLRLYLFYMPNYWSGIFTLYSLFSLLKFGAIFLLSIPLVMLMYKTNVINSFKLG